MSVFSAPTLKTMFGRDSSDKSSSSAMKSASRLFLGGILIIASILAFAPLYPRMPEAGLDPSWMLAINQAVAQGLVFGRDIVFTFGPYAALYTQAYHPVTYPWALTLGLMLGLCYAAMLLMAMRQKGNGWLWLYAGFLFLVDSRDALFFSYPLLVVLVAYKATLPGIDPGRLALIQGARIHYALAVALLGLLPVIKGSFIPLSLVGALAGSVLFWRNGERAFALLFIVLPLLTMVALWHVAGQPINALPDFFHSMSPIISGFPEAMSRFPDSEWLVEKIGMPGMIAAYIMAAFLILLAILRARRDSIPHTIVVIACAGLFLFLAFKAGFVRHDGHHALAAGSALVLAAISLSVFGIARVSWGTTAFAITTWALIHAFYVGTSLNRSPLPNLYGVLSGDRMGGRAHAAFAQRLERIHSGKPIPRLEGTTDIYPYDQAALIASGNNWLTRPVPQSYSVYTPGLARLNEGHLKGLGAPDNVVFRVATIDDRYPSLDDGLSWPTLISHYAISAADENFVYLKKLPVHAEMKKVVVMQGGYTLGSPVALPQGERILFAEIDVSPTLLGRIATVAFKPSPLYISVNSADGQSQTYRFIPSMARTGFILSPLIESTSDFVQLAGGHLPSLAQKQVNSISIGSAGSGSVFWKEHYLLKISALDMNRQPSLQELSLSTTQHKVLPE